MRPGLTAATYNVHGFVGRDRRADPIRTARVVRELDADVVGLQEALLPADVGGDLDLPVDVPGLRGYRAVVGATRPQREQLFGNALLSRWPALEVRRVDLSGVRGEPRGAIDVVLDAAGGRVRVVVTHLGLGARARRQQLARLRLHLRGAEEELLILLGDVNEWRGNARALRELDRELGAGTRLRTYPTPRPVLPLDRIWVRPRRRLERVWVHRSARAAVASDHYPLLARVSGADGEPAEGDARDPAGR